MQIKVVIDDVREEVRLFDTEEERDEFVTSVLKSKTNTIKEVKIYEYLKSPVKTLYGVRYIDHYHYEK